MLNWINDPIYKLLLKREFNYIKNEKHQNMFSYSTQIQSINQTLKGQAGMQT